MESIGKEGVIDMHKFMSGIAGVMVQTWHMEEHWEQAYNLKYRKAGV
ncbi:hypothetical protein [Clostridium tyrobutyricum]|nr:hypothetical protein [Clostridium tyrobutyricum]MEA5009916.1 hypothetical protein [Clostridium tyrobutyricum]